MTTLDTVMQNDNRISQSSRRALRNPWVLGWLALVAIVLLVNIVMITLAMTTSPGLVNKDYYERGRDHERNLLTRQAARSALGWSVSLEVPEQIRLGTAQTFRFTATDRVGQPLRDAQVNLNAFRPSDARADFSIVLHEVASGQYEVQASFPLKGTWDLIIQVQRGEESYDLARRISVLAD